MQKIPRQIKLHTAGGFGNMAGRRNILNVLFAIRLQFQATNNTELSKSIFIAGGAGGVGTFAIMFAKQLGLQNIVTTAGNDKSLSYLIQNFQLEKEQIINYKDDNFI